MKPQEFNLKLPTGYYLVYYSFDNMENTSSNAIALHVIPLPENDGTKVGHAREVWEKVNKPYTGWDGNIYPHSPRVIKILRGDAIA